MTRPTHKPSAPAIQVRGLTKTFKVYDGPLDVFREHVLKKPSHQLFTALEGVSFSLEPGEVLGVIGPNGAGKSTLLRILAGTLDRTAGEILISGKVSSILELGTGFHPDFSGRENVYLAGLCHGMKAAEVRAKIPWIKEFSALGDFFEKPVRTYSSGMQARLFFSAAAAVEADILLVDEALSVGDARFQRKCFARMERFRDKGGAVILVSHDINLVMGLCDKALLLEKGRVISRGPSRDVSRIYFRRVHSGQENRVGELEPPASGEKPLIPAGSERYGNGRAEIVDYGLKDHHGRMTETITSGQQCHLFIKALLHQDIEDLRFSYIISTVSGINVFGFNTADHPAPGPLVKDAVLEARLKLRMWLAPGEYFLTFGIWPKDGPHYDRLIDALLLRVVSEKYIAPGSLVNLEPELELVRVGKTDSGAGEDSGGRA